ncbi:MAG: shikimate kinase [Lachnospiraceae bacterium]|nr:shikimate kinase [Robinsoniella sp.]MDY3767406.1 shikimate kinase [Lachnospiraceae bacterium]
MNHIILIGFMGSGKTSVGHHLSEALSLPFLDTDEEIEKNSQMKITDIFSQYGERYFRNLETETLEKLSEDQDRKVISVGGGLPVEKVNQPYLKEMGSVIFLEAKEDTLVTRLQGDTTRPMLKGADLRERIRTLMAQRQEAYDKVADFHIQTDEKTFEEIIEEIVRKMHIGGYHEI